MSQHLHIHLQFCDGRFGVVRFTYRLVNALRPDEKLPDATANGAKANQERSDSSYQLQRNRSRPCRCTCVGDHR
jgi:hypothetical protein